MIRFVCVFFSSVLLYVTSYSKDSTVSTYEQIDKNLDKLSTEIKSQNQGRNNSEIHVEDKYQNSAQPISRYEVQQQIEKQIAKQKQKNTLRFLSFIFAITVLFTTLLSRYGKRKREKAKDDAEVNQSE